MDQKELARILGINRVTLSRAVNDSPRVSEELKERVRQACVELGYRPNHYARSLVRQQTRTISVLCTGFAMSDLHNRWVGEIQGQVSAKGYRVRLDLGNALDELLAEGAADGFIIFGPPEDVESGKLRSTLDSMPVVFVDCAYTATTKNVVATDNAGGAALAVDHLASLGHRRIGFFGLVPASGVCHERHLGYKQGLSRNGLAFDPGMTVTIKAWPWTVEETYRYEGALRSLIDAGATSILAASDISAVGVIKMLKTCGLQVPRNISVVGFDDTTLTQSYDPRLTCVRQDIWETANRAVGMLLDVIETGAPSDPILIPSTLCIRESTAAAAPASAAAEPPATAPASAEAPAAPPAPRPIGP